MKELAVLLLLAVSASFGADEPIVSRVYQLKYADPVALNTLLTPYVRHIQVDRGLKAMSVTMRQDAVADVEQIIKRFDVPPPPVPNVEVTIYMMSALPTPSVAPIPPELEPVIKQLKSMFSYKSYQLIDTEVIRVRAGQGGDASAVVDNKGPSGPSGAKTISEMKFRSVTPSTDERGRAMRIDGLKVGLKTPTVSGPKGEYQYIDTGISTDVDIREGQKVVVGKVNMDGADRASIVVLAARVVE
jgi:hypothetical protein